MTREHGDDLAWSLTKLALKLNFKSALNLQARQRTKVEPLTTNAHWFELQIQHGHSKGSEFGIGTNSDSVKIEFFEAFHFMTKESAIFWFFTKYCLLVRLKINLVLIFALTTRFNFQIPVTFHVSSLFSVKSRRIKTKQCRAESF